MRACKRRAGGPLSALLALRHLVFQSFPGKLLLLEPRQPSQSQRCPLLLSRGGESAGSGARWGSRCLLLAAAAAAAASSPQALVSGRQSAACRAKRARPFRPPGQHEEGLLGSCWRWRRRREALPPKKPARRRKRAVRLSRRRRRCLKGRGCCCRCRPPPPPRVSRAVAAAAAAAAWSLGACLPACLPCKRAASCFGRLLLWPPRCMGRGRLALSRYGQGGVGGGAAAGGGGGGLSLRTGTRGGPGGRRGGGGGGAGGALVAQSQPGRVSAGRSPLRAGRSPLASGGGRGGAAGWPGGGKKPAGMAGEALPPAHLASASWATCPRASLAE